MIDRFSLKITLFTICLIGFISCIEDDDVSPLNTGLKNEDCLKLSSIWNYEGEIDSLKFVDELEYSNDTLVKITSSGDFSDRIEVDTLDWVYEFSYSGDTLLLSRKREFSTIHSISKHLFKDGYLSQIYKKEGNWAWLILYSYNDQKLMNGIRYTYNLSDSDSLLSDSMAYHYDIDGVNISKVESFQNIETDTPDWKKIKTFEYTYDYSRANPISNIKIQFALGYGFNLAMNYSKNLHIENKIINHFNTFQETIYEYKYKFSDSSQILEIEEFKNSILNTRKVLEYETCE